MEQRARWKLPSLDCQPAGQLAAALGIQAPAARVLWQRGYRDPDSARRFLHPSLADLHDPFLLKDMEAAAERIRRAVAGGEKILLYGDYDVDGTSSIVILKKVLDLAGGTASFHVPHRLRDGYGMRPEVVERAAAEGVTLIISVDTGIRAAEVVRHAAAHGIDCIITDHHLPEDELPPALAVINPNRLDCSYPEKNLCGAGVTFKLIQAFLRRLQWPDSRIERVSESLLKLVAIATVADVVPLTGENRIIVKRGLAGLNVVRNHGLRALLRVSGFNEGESPSAGQVALRVAPRINAAGRMASASDVIEMFLTDDPERAQALADQLHLLNQNRQQTEAEMIRSILEECERGPVADSQAALVFSAPGWHRGVLGIVASRIVDRFHRPVFVLSEDPETGLAQGSGRSIPDFHLLDALEAMEELFIKFGGHRQAAGVTLSIERVGEFRERFQRYAAQRLSPEDFIPQIEVDSTLDFHEINDQSAMEILSLAPFGYGNPAPLFVVRNAEVVSEPALWKERHLRLSLRQNGRCIHLKGWGLADRISDFALQSRVDAIVCFEEDSYSLSRGYPGWSITLKDARSSVQTVSTGSLPQ